MAVPFLPGILQLTNHDGKPELSLFDILDRMTSRIAGFHGEFLWEFEIATRQTLAIAECIPAEKYDWRPGLGARSISEVFVHVATGQRQASPR